MEPPELPLLAAVALVVALGVAFAPVDGVDVASFPP
jgi:hypothetical protein